MVATVILLYGLGAVGSDFVPIVEELGLPTALPFAVCDEPYARFYTRCEVFREGLEQRLGRRVTPREVDKVLLAVADWYRATNGEVR